jgi:hypothetical protein
MNDAELIALAALVNGWSVEGVAANEKRARQDYAPAYDGHPFPEGLKCLEAELKLRGVLKA